MRTGGIIFVVYLVIGILVAAGVIGNESNYFTGMDSLEEVIEMLLAVILWPLVLLGVDLNIGGNSASEGGGGSGGGQGGGGGGGQGGSGGGGSGGK